jgi:hypothetical protein
MHLSLSTASADWFLYFSSSQRVGFCHLLFLDKLRTKSDRVQLTYQTQMHLGGGER